MGWVIIANGRRNEEGIKEAVSIGANLLDRGHSAINAIEATIRILEDNPIFDAGTGCEINLDGLILMDASIMDGATLKAGAVGAVKGIKNPITLARRVMEKTPYVLLVGDGAEKFARLLAKKDKYINVDYDARTEGNKRRLKKVIDIISEEKLVKEITSEDLRTSRILYKLLEEGKISFLKNRLNKLSENGTVSASALDQNGNFAAGSSTGGWTFSFPGRLGDSPLIGCGAYADNQAGASSTAYIRGEDNVRLGGLTRKVCDLMSNGHSAQDAIEAMTNYAKNKLGLILRRGSLIAIDNKGNPGFNYKQNAPAIGVGLVEEGMKHPIYPIKCISHGKKSF